MRGFFHGDAHMSIDYSSFFKSYDIRGTVPHLNAAVYYWAGRGFVETILKPDELPLEVNLVRDGRYSSPEFYEALYWGLVDAGAKVRLLGMGSTDTMYAACLRYNNPGAMVTASHNPKDDNGLKIVKRAPQMLGMDGGLDLVRDYVLARIDAESLPDFSTRTMPHDDEDAKVEVMRHFSNIMAQIGDIDRINTTMKSTGKTLKIAVDTANGMGGFIMSYLTQQYSSIDWIPLYWEVDGTFPNHPADPMVESNLVDLKQAVLDNQADLGVAFDGDADRAFFVDENGQMLNGEHLVAVVAEYMTHTAIHTPDMRLNPAVVYVISYSRCLADVVLQAGGAAIVSKQGHTHVKRLMNQYNAVYGGEASGHHYYGQFGYMDSGILTVGLLIQLLIDRDVQASELTRYYQDKYFVSGENNYRLPDGLSLPRVKEIIKDIYSDGYISELDGITVYYPDWKLTIRGSNTEPLLRINIETKKKTPDFNPQERLAEIVAALGL